MPGGCTFNACRRHTAEIASVAERRPDPAGRSAFHERGVLEPRFNTVAVSNNIRNNKMTEFQFNDAALANLKDKVVIVTG